jgi:hypothetical protein
MLAQQLELKQTMDNSEKEWFEITENIEAIEASLQS